ncbi:hypothetical protein D9M71_636920 [compost metagenome]
MYNWRMRMNKPIAISIIKQKEESRQNDFVFLTASIDCRYAISLGWIAYSQHVEKWLLEGYFPDTEVNQQYQKAIAEIHQNLVDNNVFK